MNGKGISCLVNKEVTHSFMYFKFAKELNLRVQKGSKPSM